MAKSQSRTNFSWLIGKRAMVTDGEYDGEEGEIVDVHPTKFTTRVVIKLDGIEHCGDNLQLNVDSSDVEVIRDEPSI